MHSFAALCCVSGKSIILNRPAQISDSGLAFPSGRGVRVPRTIEHPHGPSPLKASLLHPYETSKTAITIIDARSQPSSGNFKRY